MRSAQNALGNLHLVEMPGDERRVGIVRGVFAVGLLVRSRDRLRRVARLMDMRCHHSTQHEGQKEEVRTECTEALIHRERR